MPPEVARSPGVSLRAKVFAFLLVVEVLALSLLLWQGWRLDLQRMERDFVTRFAQTRSLLNAAVAGPLASGDYPGLERALRGALDSRGLDYFVAKDREGRVAAVLGSDRANRVPRLQATFDEALAARHFDTVFPVIHRGEAVGFLHVGASLERELDTLAEARSEDIFRAVGAILFSILLFLGLIQPLAGRLARMQRAAEKVAAGDYDVHLADGDPDEVGTLARGLDRMALEVRTRVGELNAALTRLESANSRQALTAATLQAEQSRLLSLLSAMNFGVVFVDRDRRIIYANPSFAEMWSIPPDEFLPGCLLDAALAEAAKSVTYPDAFLPRLYELIADEQGRGTLELRFRSGRMVKLMVCPVVDEGRSVRGSVLIHEDVTQARSAESHLAFLAERDPLTGLYNRRRFETELDARLEGARRSGRRVALFFLDLDEFKTVNDLFGHRMGDAVLRQVAGAVGGQLRQGEFFARLGGDEFALVVDAADEPSLRALAERLMRALGGFTVALGEVRLTITVSMGIAVSPEHAKDAQELVAHADAAMYQAKDAGKNTWRLYQPDHSATLRQRSLVTWNDRIRRALKEGGLEFFLQGVFGTEDRKRRYSEALLRMRDENGPLLSPAEFIPYAEKSNLILEIDRWMIDAVIGYLADRPNSPPIAVNVSGRSFDDATIAEHIASRLAQGGVEASRLIIEITETSAIRDMREAQRFIERVHRIGCKVSLDDFGAGFASFAYIKQLPVDVLKIDGLFVRDLAQSRDNQVFVKAMLDVARGFGKLTVAESVEDGQSLAMLRAFGVDMVQGFMLERPQSATSALVSFDREHAASKGEGLLSTLTGAPGASQNGGKPRVDFPGGASSERSETIAP